LKSCCRDRAELKEMGEKILEKLGTTYTLRIIGYTIVVKKWRREKRSSSSDVGTEEEKINP
jgi:hypothetical protein